MRVQTPTALIEYLYSPLGNRIAKLVNGQITERYQWLNHTTLLAVYDSSGTLIQRYGYSGERTPTVLEYDGQKYYILSDYQGTPKLVTNASGNVVKVMSFDSYGNLLQDSNPMFKLSLGYAGGLYDIDTGLTLFGVRDYDADIGRWTARDPIGFEAADSNLYRYNLSDPINYIDINGKTPINVAIGVVLGGIILYGMFDSWSNFYRDVENLKNAREKLDKIDLMKNPQAWCEANNALNQAKNKALLSGANAAASVPGTSVNGPPPTTVGDAAVGALGTVVTGVP